MKTPSLNLTIWGIMLLHIFSLTSCAFHSGMHTSSASITNSNFKIAGLAEGYATTTHILGIGGLRKDALVLEARKNLYSRFPLPKGMLLGNVTVDFKTTYFLIGSSTLATFSGDIVDFNSERFNSSYKGFYTDDSTFFPTSAISDNQQYESGYYSDYNTNYFKKNAAVSFFINNQKIRGTIVEINTYGFKCSYQTPSGEKRIYLKSQNLTLVE